GRRGALPARGALRGVLWAQSSWVPACSAAPPKEAQMAAQMAAIAGQAAVEQLAPDAAIRLAAFPAAAPESAAAIVAATARRTGRLVPRAADWSPAVHARSCRAAPARPPLRWAVSLCSCAQWKPLRGAQVRRMHQADQVSELQAALQVRCRVDRADPRAGSAPRRQRLALRQKRADAHDTSRSGRRSFARRMPAGCRD